jgi:hypothetical protein
VLDSGNGAFPRPTRRLVAALILAHHPENLLILNQVVRSLAGNLQHFWMPPNDRAVSFGCR